MVAKFANNAVGTLALSISDVETSITVSGDEGERFPVLTEGDYFFATLVDADGNREIIRVTARTGNTMTVERGQEGTNARSFAAGSKISHRLTAAFLNAIAKWSDLDPSDYEVIVGLDKSSGNFVVGDGDSLSVASGSEARALLGLGSIATQAANNVTITGGSISGIAALAIADGGTGASTPVGARENLKIKTLTQAAYNALNPPDPETIYLIVS